MRRLILGTAGHIDHGKTSLVKALTGVDTDRLPEEKRRGITIDLGFAALSLDGFDIGIVDVPGHEALVRNMLAGATGIDFVLLVIAADEGVMPQTREHLAIMELLEVNTAIVALTKCDLVDDDWRDLVSCDVSELLGQTRFADAPVVPVSAQTGAGIDELRAAITNAAHGITDRSRSDLFRMPVDRSFTVRGTGTVVTGTIWSGEVRRDAHLFVMPDGMPARARGLQVHGQTRDVAGAGERVALALAVDRDNAVRGHTIVAEKVWTPSMLITAHVRVLGDADKPLRHRQRVRFHLGTAEILARVAMLERPEIEPGGDAWVQMRLEAPCIARTGDRFVIRSYSPVHTIAGGVVVEPMPPKRKKLRDGLPEALRLVREGPATAALEALVRLAGADGVGIETLSIVLGGTLPAALHAGSTAILPVAGRLYDAGLVASSRQAVLALIDRHHELHPISRGATREDLRPIADASGAAILDYTLQQLGAEGLLRVEDGGFARTTFRRSADHDQARAVAALAGIFQAAGLEAPAIPELPPELQARPDLLTILRFMEGQGTLVFLAADRFADRGAIGRAASDLAARFVAGQSLTTSELKDAIGVSRKYLIPILEYFDRAGLTRRAGENREWRGPSEVSAGTLIANMGENP